MTSQVPASILDRANAEGDGGRSKAAHFVFVPLREQGHLIPAVDTALLLATHGALCTIVAPPSTAALVRRTVSHDVRRRQGLQRADEYDETVRELEARVGAARCLLIRGWAPQLLILSHDAMGAFVTHCGWNSTLEAVAAGLPMVTWPHFTDQFLNEKMVVEVLGIGVSVGVEEPLTFQAVKKEVLVGRDVVEEAVRSVMGDGEEAVERRRRAFRLHVLAGVPTPCVLLTSSLLQPAATPQNLTQPNI